MTLQPGIHIAPGRRPPPCFRLVTLDVAPGATPAEAAAGLAELSAMLAALAEGRVRDLEGVDSRTQFGGLEALFGYGRRLFDDSLHDPPLTRAARPDFLAYLTADGPYPALRWAGDAAADRPGEGDVAIQLTAPRRAAVECAAVERWKLISDRSLPLAIRGSFDGFGRDDGRGWLDFHDGVSNLEASQREAALAAGGDPGWMAGGTYMAYLRLAVDLARWRGLTRTEQELAIGRDKRTGGALVAVERTPEGGLRPVAAPAPGDDANDRELADFIEPPQTADPLLEASHIHRVNQNRASPYAPAGMRMFRQGYDFLEQLGPGGARLGLNFVSFQRTLAAFVHVLHLPGWLGDSNFGGGELELLSVLAGGLYAVPPAGDPFPGAELFAG